VRAPRRHVAMRSRCPLLQLVEILALVHRHRMESWWWRPMMMAKEPGLSSPSSHTTNQ